MTLFHFMVINNWFVTIDMYEDVMGNRVPTYFFVLFWVFVILVLLNVLIALILEIYSSVEPEVAEKVKKSQLTQALAKIVEGIDKETLAERFTEVR